MTQKIESPFAEIGQHVLLPWATQMKEAAAIAHGNLSPGLFSAILAQVPDAWLGSEADEPEPGEKRAIYADFFARRLAASEIFEEEAMSAHARLL